MKILLTQIIQKVILLWFYYKGTIWLLQFPDSLHSLSLDLVQLRGMSVVYNVYLFTAIYVQVVGTQGAS